MTSSTEAYPVPPAFAAAATPAKRPRIAPARLDSVLRGNTLLVDLEADARVVDPRLAKVVEQAAEKAREAARAEGFAAGYREGLEMAEREVRSEIDRVRFEAADSVRERLADLRSAAMALAAAAASLEQRSVPTFEHAGDQLGPVVVALVEELLGRELGGDPLAVVGAIRKAAAEAPGNAPLTVRVNPADAAAVAAEGIDLAAIVQRPFELYTDDGVERGGAVADSGARRIDAQLSRAVDRLREALR